MTEHMTQKKLAAVVAMETSGTQWATQAHCKFILLLLVNTALKLLNRSTCVRSMCVIIEFGARAFCFVETEAPLKRRQFRPAHHCDGWEARHRWKSHSAPYLLNGCNGISVLVLPWTRIGFSLLKFCVPSEWKTTKWRRTIRGSSDFKDVCMCVLFIWL